MHTAVLCNQLIEPASRKNIEQSAIGACSQQAALVLDGGTQAFFW